MLVRMNDLANEVQLASSFVLVVPLFDLILQILQDIIGVLLPECIFTRIIDISFEFIGQALAFLQIHGFAEVNPHRLQLDQTLALMRFHDKLPH